MFVGSNYVYILCCFYNYELKKEVGNTDEAQVNAKTEIEDDVDMEVGEIRERLVFVLPINGV